MTTLEKLNDLNATITNTARARQDCVGTLGDTDATIVGHLDAMLLRYVHDGLGEAKELIIGEGMMDKDESLAVSAFYSLRRQVLDILKPEKPKPPVNVDGGGQPRIISQLAWPRPSRQGDDMREDTKVAVFVALLILVSLLIAFQDCAG